MNNEIKKPQPPRQILRAGIYAPVPTFEEVFKASTKTAEPDIDADDDLDKSYFRFYYSYYNSIQTLSKENQFLAFKAIVEYAFTNIKNEDLPKPVLGILRTIRPFIKAQKKRQIAGMAGKSFGKLGAPYGKKGGRPRKKETKTEKPPTKKIEVEKPEPVKEVPEEPEEEDCRELVLFLLTDGAYRFVVRRRQIITSKRSTAIWRSPFS